MKVKKEIKFCKMCGKAVSFGSCCRDCYYEYHESKAELMADYPTLDDDIPDKEDEDETR